MERIFFIHVPKCGGTSLAKAIKTSYYLNRIFKRHKGIESIYAVPSNNAANAFGEPIGVFRNKLAAYIMGVPYNMVLMGHIPFEKNLHTTFSETWNYITLLRDPVDRWYSSFYYLRKRVPDQFPHEMPTEEFLESDHARLLATYYAYFFGSRPELYTANFSAGPAIEDIDWQQLTKDAKENLSKFSLVGFLDDLDDFSRNFKKKFKQRIYIGHKNRNQMHRQRRAEVGSKIHDKIVSLCKEDIEIYQWSKTFFKDKLS